MDEDPDYDYEMDPQAAYIAIGGSAEETMEDVASEGMAMSDAGMHADLMDKTGIDVDFQDSADPYPGSADVSAANGAAISAPSAYIENGSVYGVVPVALEDQIYEVETIQELDGKVEGPYEAPIEVPPYAQESIGAAIEATNDHDEQHEQVKQLKDQTDRDQGVYEEDEQDELRQDTEEPAPPISIQPATIVEESDQLEDEGPSNGEGDHQESGQGEEGAENGYAAGMEGFYHSDDQEVATIRVTFNGQDFVMWSAADIPAYLALPDKSQGSEGTHDEHELLQVEAPALEVQQDVLWQPLDSLFASLRENNALGDFLEESQELHIAFPDLDLHVAEDNLYCREITLDDLLQLHHGLGLLTSLHIQVSERPRFITKYNELAQHVAGILGNQLQHSSDDSEEEEAAYHQRRDGPLKNVMAPITVEAKESSSMPAAQILIDAEKAHDVHAAAVGEYEGAEGPADAAVQGDAIKLIPNAQDNQHLQSIAPPQDTPVATSDENGTTQHNTSEEAAEEVRGDAHKEDELQHNQTHLRQEVSKHGGMIKEVDEAQEVEEADQVGNYGVNATEIEREGEGGAKGQEQQASDHEADHEEAEEKAEEEARAEGEGQEEVEEISDEVEWQEDGRGGGEEEYEDQEYGEDAEYVGEEAEQTFYTTIGEGSEGEEDELEEPEQQVLEGTHQAEGQEYESTYAYDAIDNEPNWQEGKDEQIVEYTEEQGEGITSAQRKRGLVDDDDDALYEERDHEAESKRVKVD